MNKKQLSAYMSSIGRKGGKVSKRKLTKKDARAMAKLRWTKKGKVASPPTL